MLFEGGDVSELYIFNRKGKKRVETLADAFASENASKTFMDVREMRPQDVAGCRWLNFKISRGITSPGRDISVYANVPVMPHGLHGEMLRDFPGTDLSPLCYDTERHIHGFGGFVRWVLFSHPNHPRRILGIDYSLIYDRESGIAYAVIEAARTVKTLVEHGLDLHTEIVLLNWRMCEETEIKNMRLNLGLLTADGWILKSPKLFTKESGVCPRCGLITLKNGENFCGKCGANPNLFLK